jgi:hypothetical protein
MGAWMRFHLDPVTGRDGLRLSPAAAAELTAPQMYISRSDFAEIGPMQYGFGFFVGHYRGARCIGHSGGPWCGYNCDLRLLPDRGSGVIVMTNGHDPGCAPLINAALDDLLGLEPLPWLDRFRSARPVPQHRSTRATVRQRYTWRSRTLADYAHEYAHPAGTVRIITDGDRLRWRGLGLDLAMEHRHSDVFDVVAEPTAWPGNKNRAIRQHRRRRHRDPDSPAGAGGGADRLRAPIAELTVDLSQ